MKKWRLFGGLTLVLALGILLGALGTRFYDRYRWERYWKDPAERRAAFLHKLTRDLRLTEGQQKEFRSIVEEVDRTLDHLRQERRTSIRKILDESFVRMKEKLEPDQRQRLDELKARHEERTRDGKGRPPFH